MGAEKGRLIAWTEINSSTERAMLTPNGLLLGIPK